MNCKLQEPKTASGLGSTPARVNRLTGAVFLNAETWHKLSESAQKFILAHEEGHFCKQTRSEFQADKYAFNKIAGKENKSLRKILHTINTTLEPELNEEHNKRVKAITRQILLMDFMEFGNKKAYLIFKKMEHKEINNLFIEFLRSKGINNVNNLSNDFKNQLIKEFLLTDDMQNILISRILNDAENLFSNYVSKLELKPIKIPTKIKEKQLTVLSKDIISKDAKPPIKISKEEIKLVKSELLDKAKKDIEKKVSKLNKALVIDDNKEIIGTTIEKVVPDIDKIVKEETEEKKETNGKTNDNGGKNFNLPDNPIKPTETTNIENKDKNKTTLIIVIGVLAITVIGLLFYKSRN